MIHRVKVGSFEIGNDLPFALLAGPCVIESRQHALEMSHALVELTQKLGIKFIYKTSFDKANRSSIQNERGVALKDALSIFAEIREKWGCPIVTDIH